MRAAIYIRVSSEEQVENWSLGAQLERCQAHAAANGWTVTKVYEDAGYTAKTDQRPALQRLLRDAEAGQFEALIVYKLDRLSRRQGHLAIIVERLVAAGVRLASATEHLPWENVMQRDLIIGVHGLIAQIDNQNRAQETTKGKAARARAGFWNGSLPFGYTTAKLSKKFALEQLQAGVSNEGEYNTRVDAIEAALKRWSSLTEGDAIPDPGNADGLYLIFERYSCGTLSFRDIGNMLNELGYHPTGHTGKRKRRLFGPDTIRDILQNRFYLGETQYKGEWFEGRHPALISPELFELCQQVRQKRRLRAVRGKSVRRVYPLSRLVHCARCGETLRGQANRSNKRYYRDMWRATTGCDQRMIPAESVEQTVLNYLSHIQLPPDWHDRILQLTRQRQDSGRIEAERRSLQTRLERLRDLYKWGEIEKKEYLLERDALKTRLMALQPTREPDLEEAAAMLENVGQLLRQATLQELEAVFHALFERVYVDYDYPGHVCAIEPKQVLHRLMDVSLLPNWSGGNPDPDESGAPGKSRGASQRRVMNEDQSAQIVARAERDIMYPDAGKKVVLSVARTIPVAPALTTIKINIFRSQLHFNGVSNFG